MQKIMNYNRELVFENVRQEQFPNIPSRLTCCWFVYPKKEFVRYWLQALKENPRIMILSATGIVFHADSSYLSWLEYGSNTEMISSAKKYWQGTEIIGNETEFIFAGKIKVEEIYNDISEIDFEEIQC